MMWKLILFLCFTAVHVLGEGQENILSKNSDVLPVHTTPQNNTENIGLSDQLMKTVSPEPVSISADVDKKKSGSDRASVNQSSIQHSTVVPVSSTVILANNTAPVIFTKDESSDKWIPFPSDSLNSVTIASHGPGKWIVNGKDKICIIVQMFALFNISYVDNQNKTSFKTFDIPVDNSTRTSGNCGTSEQNLTLYWSSKNITNASMTLHFVRNGSESDYSFHHFEIAFPTSNLPNTIPNNTMVLVHEASNYVVGLSNSYRCLRQQKFNLKQNASNETHGYVTISDLQFQAFKTDNSTVFSLAKDCAFDTPDVVPIAVGCALAGLVIIVLIAYLIGRRRSQGHGYLSM
ncbi:lysosome-associated membrane glycoprotein 1 isoform X2 [Xylocopa sonorina]